jgi:hypothetical protein
MVRAKIAPGLQGVNGEVCMAVSPLVEEGKAPMTVIGKLIDRMLSGPDRREVIAQRLYAAMTTQARRPEFYLSCGVPDSVDGRFEMVALHAFLLFAG